MYLEFVRWWKPFDSSRLAMNQWMNDVSTKFGTFKGRNDKKNRILKFWLSMLKPNIMLSFPIELYPSSSGFMYNSIRTFQSTHREIKLYLSYSNKRVISKVYWRCWASLPRHQPKSLQHWWRVPDPRLSEWPGSRLNHRILMRYVTLCVTN